MSTPSLRSAARPFPSFLLPVFAAGALGLATAACGGAAAPAKAPGPAAATLQRPAGPALLGQVKAALERGGHRCGLAKEVVTCEADDPKRPTLAVLVADNEQGAHVFLVESFIFKTPQECAQLVPKLNEVQGANDLLRVTCDERNLIFSLPILVPELGLTDGDLNRLVSAWQPMISATLTAGGFVAHLK